MKFNIGSMKDVLLATPPVAEGNYFMQIKKAELTENKKGGTALALTLSFAESVLLDYTSNEEINNNAHNATVFDSILLTPTGGMTLDIIKAKVAKFVNAVFRDKHAYEVVEDIIPEDYVGKWVKVAIKHDPAKDGYEAKNKVGGYYIITDADDFNEPAF